MPLTGLTPNEDSNSDFLKPLIQNSDSGEMLRQLYSHISLSVNLNQIFLKEKIHEKEIGLFGRKVSSELYT